MTSYHIGELIQLAELEKDKSYTFIQSSDEVKEILEIEGLSHRIQDTRYLVVKEIEGELIEIWSFLTPYIKDWGERIK